MKSALLFALVARAQMGHAFVGPAGSVTLSNCFSAAAGAKNGIAKRGVASLGVAVAPTRGKDAVDSTKAKKSSAQGSDAPEVLGKPALIEAMAERSDMTKVEAEAALVAFTDVVMTSVSAGKKINLQGFGTFEGRSRKARTGRNPRTGEDMEIKATTLPAFSAAKGFKDMVKASHTD